MRPPLVPIPTIMLISYSTYITSRLIQLWYYITGPPHLLLLAMHASELHGPTTVRITKKPTKLTDLWLLYHYGTISTELAYITISTMMSLELWYSCN